VSFGQCRVKQNKKRHCEGAARSNLHSQKSESDKVKNDKEKTNIENVIASDNEAIQRNIRIKK
jgi:hypothetical protein